MLDTRVIERAENARLVSTLPDKEPRNPLLRSDQPWENATNNYYPNVLWDAEEKIWKLWYKDVLADKEVIAQMDAPSDRARCRLVLLYATSKDGLAWTKPELGLHNSPERGEQRRRARLPERRRVQGRARPRSRAPLQDGFRCRARKTARRVQPDGMHWSETPEPQGFTAQQGDTHNNAFFDTRSGKYLWFTKIYLGERLVTRLESDDFQHWRSSGVVLRSTLDEGRAHQTYALTVSPTANICLGYVDDVSRRRRTRRRCRARLEPGFHPLAARCAGPGLPANRRKGELRQRLHLRAGRPAVVQDGRLPIYYGGSPTVHLGWKRSGDLCLARLREDGFAAYESADGSKPAVLDDHAPQAIGTAAAARGGRRSEGRGSEFGGVRLRVTIAPGARLYSINGFTLVNTALPPKPLAPLPRVPARAEPVVVSFDQDAQGWKGADKIEHHPEGYVTISRGNNLRPIASGLPLEGDWPTLLGGDELTISARLRAPAAGGTARLEIFARDLAQWGCDKLPAFGTEWQNVSTTIRYDWTDEEARAAGWFASPQAFSWRETMRHAVKSSSWPDAAVQYGVQLDEVRLQAR